MMIDRSQACVDSLAFRIYRNGEWREFKSERFPDDIRNARAATTLKEIAATCRAIPLPIWQQIEPHFDADGKKWLDAVSLTCRDVGFRSDVQDFDGYLETLVSNLCKPTRH